MRNTRIWRTALALVVMCALGALAAATVPATASAKTAMPEIVNKEGKFPTKTGFTSTSGESKFETENEHAVTCKADTVKGKLTGASTDETEIKFTGCSTTFILTLKCETGSTTGEIVLKVASELVWLNKSEESEPGEDLVLPSEGLTIKCTSSETLHVKGSTLCPISGFKTLSSTGTITCKQSKGKQEFGKYFLGGAETKDITETEGKGLIEFGFLPSGLQSTDSLTYEEAVEII
jgi:hypothetical protein